MKKYLIKGLLALVVGGFTASCADKDGDYVPVGQQKATAYADAFKELIGGEVAPNHDWGFKKTSIIEDFSQTRANTRAFTRADGDPEVVKKDQWQNFPDKLDGNTVPADVTTKEAAYVYEWFQKEENKGLSEEGKPWTDFFIQQVYGTMDQQKKGIWHKYDQNYMTNHPGATSNYYDEEFTDKGGMDYLTVGDGTTMTHVNDFNATTGGPWNIVYMKNSSAMQFGYHSTWDDSVRQLFKLAKITVPGDCFDDGVAREGWYVGLSLLAQKYDNGDKILGEQRKDWGDDWILKIVPGDTTPSGGETSNTTTTTRTDLVERKRLVSQGRVFCEDLGPDAARMLTSDIDFNDAVFDAKIWRLGQFKVQYLNDTYDSESEYLEGIYTKGINQTTGIDYNVETEDVIVNGKFKYVAEICLLAAGGTVPLKIGGDHGFEIHDKFGEGQKSPRTISRTTIINTVGAPSQEQFTTTVSTDVCDAVTTEVDITDLVKAALLKLKNDTKISLDIIPIEVMWTSDNHQSVGVLKAETEEDIYNAPQKLCVPIGTQWVYERIPITSAYSKFAPYAKDKTPLFWEGSENRNPSLLYASGPQGMTAENGETGNVGSNPYYDQVVEQGESTTTVETVLWGNETSSYTFTTGSYENFSISTLDFAVGDEIRVYGSSSNPTDIWIHINLIENNDQWTASKDICNQASSFNAEGYMSFEITQTIVDQLTHVRPIFGIWAKNMTINRITKCRTSN